MVARLFFRKRLARSSCVNQTGVHRYGSNWPTLLACCDGNRINKFSGMGPSRRTAFDP